MNYVREIDLSVIEEMKVEDVLIPVQPEAGIQRADSQDHELRSLRDEGARQ